MIRFKFRSMRIIDMRVCSFNPCFKNANVEVLNKGVVQMTTKALSSVTTVYNVM